MACYTTRLDRVISCLSSIVSSVFVFLCNYVCTGDAWFCDNVGYHNLSRYMTLQAGTGFYDDWLVYLSLAQAILIADGRLTSTTTVDRTVWSISRRDFSNGSVTSHSANTIPADFHILLVFLECLSLGLSWSSSSSHASWGYILAYIQL